MVQKEHLTCMFISQSSSSHETLAYSIRLPVTVTVLDFVHSADSVRALQDWKHARAANKTMLEAASQAQIADFVSWRQQQLRQLQLEEDQ